MTIVRVGSNKQYADNYDRVFGKNKKKAAKKKTTTAKKKTTKKKKAKK